ncbi:hypothetical protein E4T48_06648 [Aureobasidium sp. EXF-10727]|nr:hypothetical protein E4T48_06648 [Aureobasidium sp. EXF-10727]
MLHLPPHAPPSPLFDASTFDDSTLSEDFIRNASRDPDLCLLDQRPDPKLATSKHDWVRRTKTYGVTPSVLALGKNPYPGLRVTRPIPELNQDTPAYDPFKPWFGDSYILNRLTPSRLLEEGCININTGVFAPISPRFCIDGEVATRASQARTDPGLYIGNHDGIHPVVGRNQFHLTSDYEYECLKPTLRVVTKMLEMDSVLDMLWALGSRWTQEVPTKMKKDIYVYYTGRSTHVQRMETAWELEQLSNHVHFEWGEISTLSGAQARTFYVESKPGLRGGVHA